MKIYDHKEHVVHECSIGEFERLLMVADTGWIIYPLHMHGPNLIKEAFGMDQNEYVGFSLEIVSDYPVPYGDHKSEPSFLERRAMKLRNELPFDVRPVIVRVGSRERLSLYVFIKRSN